MTRPQETLKARPRSRSKILVRRIIVTRHRLSQTFWRHAQRYECWATSKRMWTRVSHRRKTQTQRVIPQCPAKCDFVICDFVTFCCFQFAQRDAEGWAVCAWCDLKSTIEYLGEWEMLYNPDFNCTEFDTIRNAAGSNNFVLSVKAWIEDTEGLSRRVLGLVWTHQRWVRFSKVQKFHLKERTRSA